MAKLTKNRKDSMSKFDKDLLYSLEDASKIIKDFPKLKFDSSIDIAVNLGVDPKKADQNIRGVVTLPNGTGKDVKVMPNPKTGTVTMNVGKAIEETKAGKIDFKVDKNGVIHVSIGKVSFDAKKIFENALEVINHIIKIKPSSSKGLYLKSISMSSTMSPGIKIDTNTF